MESYSIEINIPVYEKDSDLTKKGKYVPHILGKLINIETLKSFNFNRTFSYLFLDIHFDGKRDPEIIFEVKKIVTECFHPKGFETIIHDYVPKDVSNACPSWSQCSTSD